MYIFSENYTCSDTLNDTGDDKNDPAKKNKVTRCTKKESVKSTTECIQLNFKINKPYKFSLNEVTLQRK